LSGEWADAKPLGANGSAASAAIVDRQLQELKQVGHLFLSGKIRLVGPNPERGLIQ
jgi:hypothetical protein